MLDLTGEEQTITITENTVITKQQGGAQQGPQGNPNAGQPNNGGKDQEVTDVDFEEVK